MKPVYDILVPGHYFCDVIFADLPTFPSLGTEIYAQKLNIVPGGALNTVVGLHRMGVKVGWLGSLGNDFFSRYIREWSEQERLDTSLQTHLDQPLQRVTVSMSYPADRAFLSYVDDEPDDLIDMTFEVLDRITVRHLHFGGLEVHPRMVELIDCCHQRGMTVSMDCQHREETLAEPLVGEILSRLDIFMPNRLEVQNLTRMRDLASAVEVLTPLASRLIVKDGKEGVHCWDHGVYTHMPSIEIEAIDTTGAGDVFNAGFLTAFLEGRSMAECLQWGNISGGLSTQGYGGCSAAPTREDVLRFQSGLTRDAGQIT